MRIVGGTLAFSASHAVQATLESHRSVEAWAGGDRVRQTEDVRVEMSGADAWARIQRAASPRGYAVAGAASLARAHGSTPGHARRRAVAPGQLTAGLASPKRASGAPTAGSPALSGTEQVWLMLVQIAGSDGAAAALADRLARFAQRMQPDSEVAQTMQAVADAHPAAGAAAAAQPDWGYREDVSVTVTESEQTAFAAAGTVTTADGRQISIAAAFELARSTQTTAGLSIRAGAALHDPLVLSAGAGAPTVGPGIQAVDVNGDGAAEQVAALAPGTAYLVRDLNGNGIVDNGSELFGPATGSGFGELAQLDLDHNGWVDEGDTAWTQLGLWTGEAGANVQTLGEAGVGAIATGSVGTPFTFGAAGQLSAAGLYLHESGQAGIVGEINLYA